MVALRDGVMGGKTFGVKRDGNEPETTRYFPFGFSLNRVIMQR